MYEVNVLTLGDETITGNMSMSKVVIDSGATESVSGVRAMARLIESLWFPYDTSPSTRGQGSALGMVNTREQHLTAC